MSGVGEDSERVPEEVICLQNKLLFIADFSKFHPLSSNEVFWVGQDNPIDRHIECARLMLGHTDKSATLILGTPDDLKLKSSMTLFTLCDHEETVFNEVLDAFYGGQRCKHTASFENPI